MDNVIQQFRASWGGFNREDVQQYVEQLNAAHRKEVAALKASLEETEARRAELEEALAGLKQENGTVVEERTKARDALEISARTLAKMRGEQTETEAKLNVAQKELQRLRSQVAQLKPMAVSYAELKNRVATVELDAHSKAQRIVDEAQAEADEVRADTHRWLDEVMAQCETVRQSTSELLVHTQRLSAAAERIAALSEQERLDQQGGQE